MLPQKCLAFVFLTLAVCASFACAQNVGHGPTPDQLSPRHFDAYWLGLRADLGPDWLFAPDDNPAYASPTFDDSGWRTVSLSKQLTDYGIHDIPYAWYRMHVHVNRRRDLAVEVQYIAGSYELYVNGVRIGANGKMVGLLESGQDYLTAYNIPDSMIGPNGDLVVAVRFAINKTGINGMRESTPLTSNGIFLCFREQTLRDATFETSRQIVFPIMELLLSLVVGMVALALYLAMRSQPEYLAIAVALLGSCLQLASIIWNHLHGSSVSTDFLSSLALGIEGAAGIEFVRLIVHMRRSRWLLALEIANLLGYCGISLFNIGRMPLIPALVAYFGPALIANVLLPVLLVRGALRRNRDAQVYLPAGAFIGFLNIWNFLMNVSSIWRLPVNIPPMPSFPIGAYEMGIWDIWNVIYSVTLLLFLVLRTIGIARERARSAAELEAARTVQQILIPEDIPTVPGFLLHSVYKPAGEVGGDFFQIVAIKGGGVLAVIGDVSGKGMPAAMTVSLLVGTFRSLAHFTQSPSEILAAMNQRMLARSSGGFTTCLVLRADADGTLTVANAGHLAPYSEGKELVLGNGLPLGLSADTTYVETTFRLNPVQQLTLLTDGVVEARSKTGVLFGFDRTAAIAREPAEAIAQAAQDFGQDDDITVVTLARTA